MFIHYLKIALRNIRKYAFQNIICILGLAAGFASFCIASICVRYENTYDTFHDDWKNIWAFDVSEKAKQESLEYSRPYEAYASSYEDMGQWPELDAAVSFRTMGGATGTPRVIIIDSTFTSIFNLELVDGNFDFLVDPTLVAVSESYARKLYGNENPIGKTIDDADRIFFYREFQEYKEHRIGAVLKDWNHSFMKADVIISKKGAGINFTTWEFLYKVKPGTDLDALGRKISDSFHEHDESNISKDYVPVRINNVHKTFRGNLYELDFGGVAIVSWASLLLVICSIINYLIFFLNSLADRRHEIALRIVHGSSAWNLTALLAINILIVLLIAYMAGMIIVSLLAKPFCLYAGFDIPDSLFMGGCMVYMLIILIVSLFICTVISNVVRKRIMHDSLINKKSSNMFSAVSLGVQLAFSIFFIFSSVSILGQYRGMFKKDLGFSVQNTAMIHYYSSPVQYDFEKNELSESYHTDVERKIAELPMVEDVLTDGNLYMGSINIGLSDVLLSLPPDGEPIPVCQDPGIAELWKPIYGFTVLQGELPERKLTSDEIVITDDVRKLLGLENPVGETVLMHGKYFRDYNNRNLYTVVAVLKEMYMAGPGKTPLPMVFTASSSTHESLLIKYRPGTRNEFETAVNDILSDISNQCSLSFAEDRVIRDHMMSTTKLFVLMVIFSGICILISIFGVWSVIVLTCRKRRREIAIRKTFGARANEIMAIFLREYGLILIGAAIPAFIAGYLFVNRWREQFPVRNTIHWWIYPAILLILAAVIYSVIISSVLRSARENPADVIKSE